MTNPLMTLMATTALTITLAFVAPAAHAVPIMSFSQSSADDTVVGTASGSSTTIVVTNAPVSVGHIAASPVPLLTDLVFNLSLYSTSAAVLVGGNIMQDYSGSFSITGNGHNYLSGFLIDVAFGANSSFVLTASTPPSGNVTFTSDYITALGLDRGASFSFADVNPGLSITNGTIASFQSSVSGTFSGQAVIPEPASLSLFAAGLLGLGLFARRRA